MLAKPPKGILAVNYDKSRFDSAVKPAMMLSEVSFRDGDLKDFQGMLFEAIRGYIQSYSFVLYYEQICKLEKLLSSPSFIKTIYARSCCNFGEADDPNKGLMRLNSDDYETISSSVATEILSGMQNVILSPGPYAIGLVYWHIIRKLAIAAGRNKVDFLLSDDGHVLEVNKDTVSSMIKTIEPKLDAMMDYGVWRPKNYVDYNVFGIIVYNAFKLSNSFIQNAVNGILTPKNEKEAVIRKAMTVRDIARLVLNTQMLLSLKGV